MARQYVHVLNPTRRRAVHAWSATARAVFLTLLAATALSLGPVLAGEVREASQETVRADRSETQPEPSVTIEEVTIRGEFEKPRIFFILPHRRRERLHPATLEPLGENRLQASEVPDPRRHGAADRSETMDSVSARRECRRVLYDTYHRLIAYIRDQGRPPPSLADLVGPYVKEVPIDPDSGRPLRYQTNGRRFSLACAEGDLSAAR